MEADLQASASPPSLLPSVLCCLSSSQPLPEVGPQVIKPLVQHEKPGGGTARLLSAEPAVLPAMSTGKKASPLICLEW